MTHHHEAGRGKTLARSYDYVIVGAGSARLEQENGGVGAVHQAARDHATRRPGADDHIVIAAGERPDAPGLMMMILCHKRDLPLSY